MGLIVGAYGRGHLGFGRGLQDYLELVSRSSEIMGLILGAYSRRASGIWE